MKMTRTNGWRDYRRGATAAALVALLMAALAGAGRSGSAPGGSSLGIAGTAALGEVPLQAFVGLPEPKAYAYRASSPGAVFAGTGGLALPAPPRTDGGVLLAILGDLGPAFPAASVSEKYLKLAVSQLNLLRPDLVLTVGNLAPNQTRDGVRHVQGLQANRAILETLKMPWYPSAGETDLLGGTRQANDGRFVELHKRYQGPLYYSVDTGDVHVIVLDSEDGTGETGGGIGDAQFDWLRSDLNRVFEGGSGQRSQWVVVTMHRPLWREAEKDPAKANSWRRVQAFFHEFNHRPIVTMEGMGGAGAGGGGEARGPRLVAVIAGGERAYAAEPTNDGIHYYVMGPTAALPRAGEDAAVAVRGMMLLKLDPDDPKIGPGSGFHPAIISLGGGGGGEAIMADDVVLAHERETLDAIAAWGEDVIGIDGVIDQRGATQKNDLRVHMKNPLPDAIDIAMRTASARFLSGSDGDVRRELANPLAEGLDLPWELSTRHTLRHLNAGASDGWEIDLTRPEGFEAGGGAGSRDGPPPQVEFVVHWSDARSRGHELVLKRRVPVAGLMQVPVSATLGEAVWSDAKAAPAGGCYAWQLRGDEPLKLDPTWQVASDGDKVMVRVRVSDPVHSYWPRMALDGALGGLASDAVSVAWARDEHAAARAIQRVWVLPFGPKGAELWTNTGIGAMQTPLLRLDPKAGISAEAHEVPGGYEVTLTLPRALMFTPAPATRPTPAAVPTQPATTTSQPATTTSQPATTQASTTQASPPAVVIGSVILNVSVHDNDEGPRTWVRSSSREESGPAGWGKLEWVRSGGGAEGN